LVATPLDLRYAIQIAGESLRQNVAGLPARVLSLLQYFKEGETQTTRSIAHAARISQRTARRWLGEDLVQAGFLTVDETGKEHLYYLADQEEDNLFLQIPSEVLFWDDIETKDWLNRQGFEVLSDPGVPTFVDPFTGEVPESPLCLQRPLTATQTGRETTASDGQTAEVAVRPRVAADSTLNADPANGQTLLTTSKRNGLDNFTSPGAVA
jgi:predicted transcriptional regulator